MTRLDRSSVGVEERRIAFVRHLPSSLNARPDGVFQRVNFGKATNEVEEFLSHPRGRRGE